MFFKNFNDRVVRCTLIVEDQENGETLFVEYEGFSKVNLDEGDVFDFKEGCYIARKKALAKFEIDIEKLQERYDMILFLWGIF